MDMTGSLSEMIESIIQVSNIVCEIVILNSFICNVEINAFRYPIGIALNSRAS